MSEQVKAVAGLEHSQIVDCLYNFIETIDVRCQWNNEYLSEDQTPSICMKQVTAAYKLRENIIGGYDAELPFAVYYRGMVNDTKGTLDITKPLNYLAEKFNEETMNKFPNLTLPDGCIPIRLEMASTPADESGKENNEAIFMALYKLTYKKKSKIG